MSPVCKKDIIHIGSVSPSDSTHSKMFKCSSGDSIPPRAFFCRLTSAQRQQLVQYKQYIEEDVVRRQKQLYKVYLESAVGANHRL